MDTASAIVTCFSSPATVGDDSNIVDAIFSMARAVERLGNADAATPMGGMEAHGAAMIEGLEGLKYISDSIDGASASLDGIAKAIERLAEAIENFEV